MHHACEHERHETGLQVPVFISSCNFVDCLLQQLTEALMSSRSTKANRSGIRLI